jgi:hypothetical protein
VSPSSLVCVRLLLFLLLSIITSPFHLTVHTARLILYIHCLLHCCIYNGFDQSTKTISSQLGHVVRGQEALHTIAWRKSDIRLVPANSAFFKDTLWLSWKRSIQHRKRCRYYIPHQSTSKFLPLPSSSLPDIDIEN